MSRAGLVGFTAALALGVGTATSQAMPYQPDGAVGEATTQTTAVASTPAATVSPTPASTPQASAQTGSAAKSATACSLGAKLVPTCGLLWGAAPSAFANDNRIAQMNAYENLQGRPLDFYHGYHTNGQAFPTTTERQIASDPKTPRLLLLNWRPATDMTWAAVASGKADARIDAAARNFTSFPHRFFLAVWHEGEHFVKPAAGSGMTATDYRDMVRHVILRLRSQGVTNAVYTQINQGYPGYAVQSWWPSMYPGDDVIDWLGVDSYNSGFSTGYNSGDFHDMVNRTKGSWNGWYNWATKSHPGKPLIIAEWGVWYQNSDPGRQAWFFDQVRTQLPQYPAIKAMSYFNTPGAPKGSDAINKSASGLSAWRALTASIPRVSLAGS